jgi:predicted enzyme related to lactoylglutathione lyase
MNKTNVFNTDGKNPVANTILYCEKFKETAAFYRNGLGLAVLFSNQWFVEYEVNTTARISVADCRKTTVRSSQGNGITLTFKVERIEVIHETLKNRGLSPTDIVRHTWGALIFHIFDPEGHRLEFWSDQS